MKIQVKTEHFRESKGYCSVHSCPLALAIQDVISEGINVVVGGNQLTIGKTNYKFSENWHDCDWINQMVRDAKNGDEIETVTVTLTEY